MDYKKSAHEILNAIGGKENIVSAAHCATRLRMVIGDNGKCDKGVLENIDGVKGVFEAQGQLQIILGTGTVNKVFAELTSEAGINGGSKDDVKQAASAKAPWYKRMIKALGDVFVPIIPAIVASGLLMGLLEGLSKAFPAFANTDFYVIFHLFSNAAFVFLPILIGISAAKTFGGNPFLGAVIGMIMIHPDLTNAWNVATGADVQSVTAWFGLYNIDLVGYQGHVIPVVIAVWFMSFLEKKLHKVVPEMLDLFVTPLVTVLVTGYLTLTIFGPIFSTLESYVLTGIQFLITIPYGIGAFLAGAVYPITVVTGIHHMYNALEAGLISSTGQNIWMPIATAANVAQGAACLAFALKTRNRKQKSVALPASMSAFLGITEPAIFGINLRFMKPFIAGIIGGAVGALFASITNISATAYGITGLFGFLITTNHALSYLLLMLISSSVAFGICWVIYKEPKEDAIEVKAEYKSEKNVYGSPVEGKAIKLSEVNDPTFAEEILGKGMAVIPSSGKIIAPCNGTIGTMFETHHAVSIKADGGAELLIHIGINTIKLNGQYFTAHVSDGDKVKAGDVLITFDIDKIKALGYDVVTPFIVANTFEYNDVKQLKFGEIEYLNQALKVEPKN